ncbi:MAG: aminoacyl-tRNA hydrolase [Actinobacteria bacterium]|nr:aminoacyl-tRNA hydrolase [Actinomycetota bacterium]MCI0544763.1 aminoacyl-tRNA hydrolase [Actinomycetota bacterium]MCI0678328.1 aminoacyl-tRNA hydrolase [Actinomycetota bacterium]
MPGEELEERFDTSGGPGGQHANRTQTVVTLRYDIMRSSLPEEVRRLLVSKLGDVVEVRAGDTRSQGRNREIARERMTERLLGALAEPRPRRRTRPTRQARERRLADKSARSATKRSRRRPEAEE